MKLLIPGAPLGGRNRFEPGLIPSARSSWYRLLALSLAGSVEPLNLCYDQRGGDHQLLSSGGASL
jgi:hypothetical protein